MKFLAKIGQRAQSEVRAVPAGTATFLPAGYLHDALPAHVTAPAPSGQSTAPAFARSISGVRTVESTEPW